MKLGMPVLFEYDNVEDNLILAQELGLDFVEWNLNFSYCRDVLEDQKKFEELTKKYNQEITLHFYDEADFGIYEEVAQAYYTLLEKYLKLGNKKIRTLNIHLIEGPVVTISGVKNYIYEKEFDTYIKRFDSFLKKVEKLCNQYDCILVIENSKTVPYMTRTYDYLNKANYKFNFDIGHDECNGNILLNYSKNNEMPFKEFHIHDSDGKRDHLNLGDGNIDIKYFKELAIKNDSYVVLEVKSSSDLRSSVKTFKAL